MKKLAVLLSCLCVAISASAQDYFEQKYKKVDPFDFFSLITKGTSGFDYLSLSEKTLIIPEYDARSQSQNMVFGKQYDAFKSQDEKKNYHRKIWSNAIEESYYSHSPYKIQNIDFQKLNKEERKKYIFLSFQELGGYYNVVLWYVNNDNEELPLLVVPGNSIDFGSKNDLRFMFNIIDQGLVAFQEYVNVKLLQDMNETIEDQSISKEERLHLLSIQELQDASNEYSAKLLAKFTAFAEDKNLLLPAEEESKKVHQAMESWKLSKFQFSPKSSIENTREKQDPNSFYIRTQTAGSGFVGSTTIWIVSTENDRILYHYVKTGKAESKLENIIPWVIEDIKTRQALYDPNCTLLYKNVNFKEDKLPADLSSKKIVYVNLTRQQYNYSGWVNKSFERKMKKYPFEYEIVDKVEDIENCKYRVFLKSSMQTFKKVPSNHNVPDYRDLDKVMDNDNDVSYVTKELFYLLLQDMETGEYYKFQVNPNFYNFTFRAFVEEAEKMNK